MDYVNEFKQVRRHPGMYLHDRTFGEAYAFVLGCDAGNDYCLLDGFREWLIVKVDGYNNLAWSALVLHVAFPGHPNPQEAWRESEENNRVAFDALFSLLDEFFVAKGPRHEGLKEIYCRYQSWLEKQDWYDPHLDGVKPLET